MPAPRHAVHHRPTIQLGGYRHLYETSPTSGRDPEADLVALQLVDALDDALELGAFTLLAAGMLGLGISSQPHGQPAHGHDRPRSPG